MIKYLQCDYKFLTIKLLFQDQKRTSLYRILGVNCTVRPKFGNDIRGGLTDRGYTTIVYLLVMKISEL